MSTLRRREDEERSYDDPRELVKEFQARGDTRAHTRTMIRIESTMGKAAGRA